MQVLYYSFDYSIRFLKRPVIDLREIVLPYSRPLLSTDSKDESTPRSWLYSDYCEKEIKRKFPAEPPTELFYIIPIPFWYPKVMITLDDFSLLSLSLENFVSKSGLYNFDGSLISSIYDVHTETGKPFRFVLGGLHCDCMVKLKVDLPFWTSEITLKSCLYDIKFNVDLYLDSYAMSSKWLLDDVEVFLDNCSYCIDDTSLVEYFIFNQVVSWYLDSILQSLLKYLNRKISRFIYISLFRLSCVFSIQELCRRIKLLFAFFAKVLIPRHFFK